ncbi:MAG: type II toxin-antitoxin system HicB family antitoxin [Candidatus Uhrbacteria bacterium]
MQRRRARTTKEHSYTVLYEPVRGKKGYQVTVPLLPGLVTFGRTFEEARDMARDAIRCYLEALRKERVRIPTERSMLQERVTVVM